MGNEKILHKFLLKNVKNNRKMYVRAVSGNNQIRTTSDWGGWSKLGRTDLNLYELPGSSGPQKRYLLISEMYPDWAITTSSTELGALQPFRFIAREMSKAKSLAELVVYVCDTTSLGFPGELAIGGSIDSKSLAGNKPTVAWANLNSHSDYVYGNDQNNLGFLGAGARWKVIISPMASGNIGMTSTDQIPQCSSSKRR